MIRHFSRAAMALALGLTALAAQSQTYPSKPIRLVIPFAPGGSTDANARIIQDKLSTLWGQPVIIDTKPGANTIIGTDLVAKSAGDGYTLLLTSTAYVVNPSMYQKLPYDPVSDFIPVTMVSVSPFALVTPVASPIKSIKDVLALERAKSASLSFGVSDSSAALSGHLFNMMGKTNMQSVSYKGAGPLMTDLAGGHVPLGIAAVSSVQTQVRAGRVRILGVGSAKPSPLFPDAPTIAADIPGYEATSWFGLFAPKGTPKDVVTKIQRDVATVMKDPDIQKRFFDIGAEVGGQSSDDFAARVRTDMDLWAKVAKSAGIKPE
ncbi:tripartite tricarboxylate transporter substrate binding protein [Limnohabitans sp. JirII-29]|uniref:tripartite tricarboxylate transporter substrate binding protein n=1 Tax=Limnohabitans sp. JirII-29 TaxID=1835756 RepID=UPI0013049C19|nr:tripartite tricarboxylate transporter substrate binding protein [Limnohabitans sp. JirII-29]